MKLIGVDVGGTFTDLIITDSETRESAIHKVPTTPDDPSEGAAAGIAQLCERSATAPGAVAHVFHGTTISTNAVLQYDGAETGMITLRRLPRHHPYRPPPAAAELFDHAGHPVAGAPAGAPAPSPQRARAAGAAPGRGAGAAGRRRRAPGRACAAREGGGSGRDLLPLRLPRPHARGTRTHHRAGGMAGGLRHHVCPRRAAVPRVRALHHGGDERLHRPQGAQLCAPLRGPAEGGRRCRRPPHHGLQRRRRDRGDGGGRAGHHPHVRAGRRRARRRLGGGAFRPPAPHHLRCRRHQRRHRHRHRRPLQRGHCARYLDRRLPGTGADDRHRDHRRRRRQHRAHRRGRRLQGGGPRARARSPARPATDAAAARRR